MLFILAAGSIFFQETPAEIEVGPEKRGKAADWRSERVKRGILCILCNRLDPHPAKQCELLQILIFLEQNTLRISSLRLSPSPLAHGPNPSPDTAPDGFGVRHGPSLRSRDLSKSSRSLLVSELVGHSTPQPREEGRFLCRRTHQRDGKATGRRLQGTWKPGELETAAGGKQQQKIPTQRGFTFTRANTGTETSRCCSVKDLSPKIWTCYPE